MITIENKKLHDLIIEKDILVEGGRKISRDIESIEIKIKRFEEKEKRITSKVVPPKELTDKGDALAKEIEKIAAELEKISNQITEAKLAAIPADMKEAHQNLMKEKEHCERERNKIALKVQKYKDKMIPILKREIKPFLGEYEDTETVKAKDGKVLVTVFSYLEDFKKRYRR